MKHAAIVIAVGLAFAATLPAPATAQNGRSFVSSLGSDSNPCTLAAPCRTLQVAFNLTNTGGEIDVLNTAGYGPLSISRAISIVNEVGVASIAVPSGGVGIIINAPGAAVNLRGLTIEGGGVGVQGIQVDSALSLTVENCVIRHLTGQGAGIISAPNGGNTLLISNTLVADIANNGIVLLTSGPYSVAVINHVELSNNYNGSGLYMYGPTINATVSESVATGNGTGFAVLGGTLNLFHSVAANNNTGISVNDGILRIAQSMINGNSTPWTIDGGVIQSYGDNYFDGTGQGGSLTPISKE
jgi:hypothetical protein